MVSTPLQYSSYLSKLTKTNFWFKREDLYPEGGGGNKARMLDKILEQAQKESATYIVTAGGPHSNFNRALALMASGHGLKVKIILYDKNPHIEAESLNKKICDKIGTEYVHCVPDEVAVTIKKELFKLKKSGETPFFIYGGGKSYEGIKAYSEVVNELVHVDKCIPALVATTFATGTTYSGLAHGIKEYSPNSGLLGISVARTNDVSIPIIQNNLKECFSSNGDIDWLKKINHKILDDYTLGGYGRSSHELNEFIDRIMRGTGLILDEIYVGKALFGLVDFLKKNPKYQDKKVVFFLTGGVFNF